MNRTDLTLRAIASVTTQGFNNIQIIVVDNSDTDILHGKILELKNKDIVYVRTGGLRVGKNWSAGVPYCEGEYVMFLLDREEFLHGAFVLLDKITQMHPSKIVCWNFIYGERLAEKNYQFNFLSQESLIHSIITSWFNRSSVVLRTQSICYPREVIFHLLEKMRGNILHPLASDFGAPVQMVLLFDNIIYIQAQLKSRYNISTNSVLGVLCYDKVLNDEGIRKEDTYSHVPIKYAHLYHTLLNGILVLLEDNNYTYTLQGDMLEAYFIMMYKLIMLHQKKFHVSANTFMLELFLAGRKYNMEDKDWFKSIFYGAGV